MSDNQDYNDEQLSQDQSQHMNGKNNSNQNQDQQNYDDDVSERCFGYFNPWNIGFCLQRLIKEQWKKSLNVLVWIAMLARMIRFYSRESQWLFHFVLNLRANHMEQSLNLRKMLNLCNFHFKGNHPRAGVYTQALHRRSGLQNHWWDIEMLLREVGKNRRCRCHEGSQDKAVKRVWIHLVLTIQHGWRSTASSSTRYRWQVSKLNNKSHVYSSSSESRFTLIEIGVSLLLQQSLALEIACSSGF